MKKAVVSGASGFLGSHTVEMLASKGWLVYAILRKGSIWDERYANCPNVIVVFSTFDTISNLPEQIGNADLFVHTAWAGVNREELDDDLVQAKNISASLAYALAAFKMKVRYFIDYGSRAEYGNQAGILSEDLECTPENAYGRAKLKAYKKIRSFSSEHGMRYLHLRFFSVFGEGDHPWSLLSVLANKLPKGEPISLGPCLQKWNFISIQDAMEYVNALILCMENGEIQNNGEIVNVASVDTRVLKEYIEAAHKLAMSRSELKFGSFNELKDSRSDVIPDVSLLRKYAPISEQGFERGFRSLLEENR